MTQSKKIGWVSVLFVLMFSLHPGIVAALDSTPLPFPGNGYVGASLHTQAPDALNQIIFGITLQEAMNHCWVTATVDGVQGVIHSDGSNGVHFLCWSDFLEICEPNSIQLFKPDKKAIGYAELEGRGINLSDIPPIFRNLLARQIGDLMIETWIQKMLEYRGTSYDWYFMPGDEELYCSELLGHGWNNTGSSFELFPPQAASTLPGCILYGWDTLEEILQDLAASLGIEISIDKSTDIYNVADILENPYFKKVYP